MIRKTKRRNGSQNIQYQHTLLYPYYITLSMIMTGQSPLFLLHLCRLIVSLMRREQLEEDNKDAADAVSLPVLPTCPTLTCPVLSCTLLSCHTLPFSVLYSTLLYSTLLSCPVLPCPALLNSLV